MRSDAGLYVLSPGIKLSVTGRGCRHGSAKYMIKAAIKAGGEDE
jgi:hypothetical protein